MSRALALGTIMGAVLLHSSAAAQTQAEFRGGLTVGSHSASAAALDVAPSVSFDLVIRRQVLPSFAVFGGFFRTAFGCEDGFCTDRDLTVVGNHGALGAEWGRGGPWLRAGVLLGVTSVGSEGERSDLGLGFHGTGGLTVGAGRVRFLPGVSYRWWSASTPSASDHAIALALDLGLAFQLGGGS